MSLNISKRDRILLCIIVVIVVLFGFDKFALGPAHRQASALDRQISTAQTALAQAQQKYATGQAALSALHKGSATWAAAQRAVPQNSDIPGLLRLLARECQAAHVNFQSITLGGAGTASPSAAVTADPSASSPSTATAIPVTLTLDGGYQAVNRLVRRLNALVIATGQQIHAGGPLIGIDSVGLNGTKALTFSLTVTIYQHASATTSPEGVS